MRVNREQIVDGVAADTRVLFIPSWVWTPNDSVQSRWVRDLSVESGLTMVTSVYGGYSIVSDPWGRVLASSHTDSVGFEHVVLADVPVERASTVYRAVGPALDWR